MAIRVKMDKFLTDADIAIENVLAEREMLETLAVFGYDAKRISQGKELYSTAKELYRMQKVEYGEQFEATEDLEKAWDDAKKVYSKHVKVARVAFKKHEGIQSKIDLHSQRSRTIFGWLAQAEQFYNTILDGEEYIGYFTKFGITNEALNDGRTLVVNVREADRKQEREAGDAQRATEKRDEAFDALDDWMDDYIAIAKIAFEDDKQLLEKMGIKA